MKRVSISKSVRFTSGQLEYIESQPGDTFTDKLSGILEDYRRGDEKRARELAYYNGQIADRRKRLQSLDEVLRQVTSIRRNAVYIEAELSRIAEGLRKAGSQ